MTAAVHHVIDSFELLRTLPDESFDVTITDPPYDAHCHANQSSGVAMARMVQGETKRGGIPRVAPQFDPLSDYAWIADLVRITRRWVVVFCTVEAFGDIKRIAPDAYVRGAIWYKPNSMGQLTGDRPAVCYEGITILHRKVKRRWNGRGSYGLWTCNGTRGEADRHKSQKPLALCLKLTALFSEPGETILDPFAGSGRIGEAATMLGRDYLGFDNDSEWVDRANARLTSVANLAGMMADTDALALCRNNGEIDGD